MILRSYPSLEAAIEVVKRTGYQRHKGNVFKLPLQPTAQFPAFIQVVITKEDYPVQVRVKEYQANA